MNPTLFGSLVSLTLVFASLTLGALVWWAVSASQKRRLQRRLRPDAEVANDFDLGDTNPVLQGIASRGKAIENVLDSEGASAKLMIQAGWRSARARLVFYVFQGLTPLLLASAVFVYWPLAPEKV